MNNNKRDLLGVLKAELEFLQKGGYRNTARVAWRPQFLFQDSPTCLNFDPTMPQQPCSDCVITQLAPENRRDQKVACRHIPLSEGGETIDSFYRSGTPEELEAAFSRWLMTTIARLQEKKAESSLVAQTPASPARSGFAAGR